MTNNANGRKSNTEVCDGVVYLWGNPIIVKENDSVYYASFCGYNTVTTRERIRGILPSLHTTYTLPYATDMRGADVAIARQTSDYYSYFKVINGKFAGFCNDNEGEYVRRKIIRNANAST